MDIVLAGRALPKEHLSLAERLYSIPHLPVQLVAGNTGIGRCSIRMLLTWLCHWRGAGAVRYPAGVWPHRHDTSDGPHFEVGPVLGPRFPLLTDDQLLRLLCEGCPFPRPSTENARAFLASIDPDVHNSAARMRAVFCASIFHEWREGTYLWRQEADIPVADRPGFRDRLIFTRAAMSRLVAGLDVHLAPLADPSDSEFAGAFIYPVGSVPVDGFAPPWAAAGDTPAGDTARPAPGRPAPTVGPAMAPDDGAASSDEASVAGTSPRRSRRLSRGGRAPSCRGPAARGSAGSGP
jgi:hypothetical protein